MRRIGRWTLVAALILIAILFGVPRVTRWIGGANARTVLVLPMEVRGQTDGADYLGRAFSEALAVNLAQARALTVLPVPVNAVGGGASREPARAARSAGAGRVVTGSILRQGKTLQASLSLVDAGGNRILWGTQRTAPDDSLTNLAIALAGNIAAELGAKSPKRYEYFLYLTGTPTMAASPAFGEALGSVRRLDAPTALVATQRLIQAFPNEPDAHLLRTAALFMDNWEVRQDPIKRRAFEQSAETLHRIDPQNPWVEHFRAMFAARDGRVDEMIDRLTRILGRQDLTPAARANILSIRSQWQAIQGNSTAAISGIEEALRLNPTDDLDLAIAGGTLLQLGRREDALVRARQAIALNPSSTQNQFLLGDSLYQLGRWDESTSPLGKACELRKGQVHCAYYALALQRAGRVPEALAQATTAIALPESDWGTSILASYHALAGHRDEALRLLRRSLELSPSPTEADVNHTLNDPDLASLRDAPEFKAILAEMKKRAQIR
jgi:tetratricopeptide (TPR) repeat protein